MSICTLAYISSLPYNDEFTRGMVQNILKNIREVPNLTAEALARRCMVSSSALRNFVKSLGYDSYSEFKSNIKHLIYSQSGGTFSISPEAYLTGVLDNVVSSFKAGLDSVLQYITDDQIEAAAGDIFAADRIIICANTSSHAQANFVAELILAGKETYIANLPKVYTDFASLVNEQTVVLFIRAGQYGDHYSISYLADAAAKGAKTIFISSAVTAADMRLADHSLTFKGNVTGDFIAMDSLLIALAAHVREKISINFPDDL